MAKEKYSFDDFITNSGSTHIQFYREINEILIENGYVTKVELKKTGYALSYIQKTTKKTLLNYVNRKKGTLIRIYGNHVDQYSQKIAELPECMVNELKKGHNCKRMINANACNSKCQMGINIAIEGEIYGKCRFAALFFLIESEKYEVLKELITFEMEARKN